MHRIDTATRAIALFGSGKDGFKDSNLLAGIVATALNAAFCNSVQEELAAPIEAVGLTLDPNNNGQLLLAFQKLIEARVGDYALDTGTANAKVVALNPAITAYSGDFTGTFKNAVANTGPCTINFGPSAVSLVSDSGGALGTGDLPAGAVVGYQYINADGKAYVTTMVMSQSDSRYMLQNNPTLGLVETFGDPAGARNRRYYDIIGLTGLNFAGTAINAEWIVLNNTAWTGSAFANRDVTGPCFAQGMTDAGQFVMFYAPSAAAGTPPVWSAPFAVDLANGGMPNFLGYRNLNMDALGASNYNCVITADEAVLRNGANQYMTVRAVNKTVNANGSVGAPLSIMTARTAATWYYRWLWYNNANGLTATLDASTSAPTPPTGYTANDFNALLPGACRTDSSGSTYLLQISTRGRVSRYIPLAGSNTPNLPAIITGVQGSVTTPTWVSGALASVVPTTIASHVTVLLFNNGGNGAMAAPSNAYGAYNSGSNPPPLVIYGPEAGNALGTFQIESANVYYAGVSTSGLACYGWEDKI